MAKLCQGPLFTVPRLLVTHDRASGSCTMTDRATENPPQRNVRETLHKFAKRRRVFLQTRPMYFPVLEGDAVPVTENKIQRFLQEVVQPVLRTLSVEVQLDLYHRGPVSTDTSLNPPKSVVTNFLMNAPSTTHLRIHSSFEAMDVLPFISARQLDRSMDGEIGQELCWPLPLMETLTVAYHTLNQVEVIGFLEELISKRGSRIYDGEVRAPGRGDKSRDDASHPPRLVKHIIVQNRYGRPFKVWESKQGWRAC